MRLRAWLLSLLCLTACSSLGDMVPGSDGNTSKLTLRNTRWNHVNMEIVITKTSDCDTEGPNFVDSQHFVLKRDQTKVLRAPNGTNVCWRHDRFPDNPHPGEWSGWSRAILFPGEDTVADI